MKCRNCKSQEFKKVINIGEQPLSGIFLKRKLLNFKKYSLDLFICRNCKLVQIGKNASETKMFGQNYGYQSSISKLMTNHLEKIYKNLITKKFINNTSSVLDIGSNDGTFLNFFKKTNILYGIDPTSNKFKNFYKPHIKRINNFFSLENVKKNIKKSQNQKFDLISSIAMFYDVNNPNNFCTDIFKLLKPNGIWVLELSYFPLLLKNLTYDQICHEHVTYLTLSIFKKIAENNNFKIVEVLLNEINGGSIQIICAKKYSKRKVYSQKKIELILKDEKNIKLKSYQNFNKRISNLKKQVNLFFLKNKKKTIYGYGASTKGNIVLNYCNITNKNLKYICDANILKMGLFTPGSNIKIISKKEMRSDNPDFLVILIWSFRREVIKEEINFLKKGGKLVFLLPRFHIIDKKNYKQYLKKNFQDQAYNY
jgi:2-polyprenyl-3-methyl-5-hydroxy-6-metoxy-1,4-benzoquinol methylase